MLNFKATTPTGAFAFGMDVPRLRLDYQGLVILEGENGTGKSSIMNSIVQSVFGKNDTPGIADEIANVVLKEGCDIVTEFEVDGEPWTAELARHFKRNGKARETDLFLFNKGGEDKRKDSMPLTYAEIRRMTGMDFEQFRATSYLGVNTASIFLDGTDAARMKIITPFLDLGTWDENQRRVRILKNAALTKLSEVKGKYDYSVEQVEATRAQLLTDEQLTSYQTGIKAEEHTIVSVVSEVDRVKASTTSVDNRIRVLESDLVRFRGDVTRIKAEADQALRTRDSDLRTVATSQPVIERVDLDAILVKRQEINKEFQAKKSEIDTSRKSWEKQVTWCLGATPEINVIYAEETDLVAQEIKALAEVEAAKATLRSIPEGELGTCPTCFTDGVTASHLSEVRKQYEEKVEALRTAYHTIVNTLTEKRKSAQALYDTHRQGILTQLTEDHAALVNWENEQSTDLVAEQKKLEAEITTRIAAWRKTREAEIRATYENKLGDIASRTKAADETVRVTQLEMDRIKLDPTTLANRARVTQLENERKECQKAIDNFKLILSDDALRAKQLLQLEADVAAARDGVAALETRVDDLEFLDAHSGDKGIKRYKLRSRLGFMNQKLTDYLNLLGLSLQVWFQDRTLKKASAKKKPELLTDEDFIGQFEVMVTDGPKVGVPLGLYSGGERTLIMLCLLGVLWETANASGRGGSNLLMIDEPFGLLKEGNRDRAIQLLEYWGSLGKMVLVSDNTGAVDQIGRRAATWKITKENHVSTIQVVA